MLMQLISSRRPRRQKRGASQRAQSLSWRALIGASMERRPPLCSCWAGAIAVSMSGQPSLLNYRRMRKAPDHSAKKHCNCGGIGHETQLPQTQEALTPPPNNAGSHNQGGGNSATAAKPSDSAPKKKASSWRCPEPADKMKPFEDESERIWH